MLPGIILILLLVGFVTTIVILLKKSQLPRAQQMTWGVLGLFSAFGFFIACIVLFSALNISNFQPRLGHYLIAKFSTANDTIGRLTLQKTNNVYNVFPKNKTEKIVGVYSGGKALTGWLNNGQVTVDPGTDMNVGLMYVLFGG